MDMLLWLVGVGRMLHARGSIFVIIFIYVFVVIFLCNSYSLAVWRFSLVQVVFRYYMLAYTAWSLQCQKSPIYPQAASLNAQHHGYG